MKKPLAALVSLCLLCGPLLAVVCSNTITTRTGKGSSLTWAEMDANLGDLSFLCTPADTWVVGPGSATDNGVCRFDATTGKLVQDSSLTISDIASSTVTIAPTSTNSLTLNTTGGALTLRTTANSPLGSGPAVNITAASANNNIGGAVTGGWVNITAGDGNNGGSGNVGGGIVNIVGGHGSGTSSSLAAGGSAGLSGGSGSSGGSNGGQGYVAGGGGTGSAAGGIGLVQGGQGGSSAGTGGNAVVQAGAAGSGGVAGAAILESNSTTNKLTCNDTNCTAAGTWTGVGDVVGPSSATDNAITRFDATTGKLVQNSSLIVDDVASGYVNVHSPVGTGLIFLLPDQTTSNTVGDYTRIQAATGNGTGAGGTADIWGGTGGAASGAGGAAGMRGGQGSATNGAGGSATVLGGAASGSGTGGSANITGGPGGASGAGGGAYISGGAAGGGSGAGGAVSLSAGQSAGATAGGDATVAAGSSSGTGVGGIATLRGGYGGSTSGTGGEAKVIGGQAFGGNSAGGVASVTGGQGAGTQAGGAVSITGGQGGPSNGGGGAVTIQPGAPQSAGAESTATIGSRLLINSLSCGNTSCVAGGTWTLPATATARAIVPLAYAKSPFAIGTAQVTDDCLVIGTNLGTTYKSLGAPAMVKMDGFSRAIMYCRAKDGAGQSGTTSCKIANITDSTDLVTAATTTSTTCTTLTTTATGVALTGAKMLECQIKNSVSTDDPQFGTCSLVLEP